MNRFNAGVLNGIVQGMDAAALLMKNNILRAFAVGGPGWRPLHPITIGRKIKSGAPDPFKILHEFNVMRNSIDIKDMSTARFVNVGRGNVMNHVRAVGLFEDTAKKYDPSKEIGFRGPLDVVKRGMKHEFGGFEWQYLKERSPGVKEVTQIEKKPTVKKQSQLIYIPERSFLRMPFDISEESLVRRIVDAIRQRIDLVW